MALPLTHYQDVWNARATDQTVALDSEFKYCPTKVIEIVTTGFSGALDIKGAIGGGTKDNVTYVKLGATAQAVSAAQLTWITDTGRYRYLVTEPMNVMDLVMTRSAGSITCSVMGWEQALWPLGFKANVNTA